MWLAAALAYFAAFAVAPLVIVITEIAGLVIHNHHQMLNLIFGYLRQTAGSGADAVRQIVAATFNQPRRGVLAETVGWVIFVIAAVGLFSAMQFALNTVWEVLPKKVTFKDALVQRASSFGVMLAVALLLLASLVVNAALTTMSAYLSHLFFGLATFVKIADFLLSFATIWAGFALLYRFLPDSPIEWSDVRMGAAVTSLLFIGGEFLLGWYLGRIGVSSGYGAFGSLVLFLIWVYYSAQIVLFGAELTHTLAQRKRRVSSVSTLPLPSRALQG